MRARNLKPGFFKNAELADAGPICQLLFAGLWCMADKEGRLKNQPRVIKAELFPYYDVDINRELTVIERLGHIRKYEVAGVALIEVLNFQKHQSPHHTEKGSELPGPIEVSPCSSASHEIHGEITVNSQKRNGGNPSDSLIPDSLIPDSNEEHASVPDARKRSERGTRVPEPFEVTTDLRQWLASKCPLVVCEDATEEFIRYWRGIPGQRGRKADWPATWQNRMTEMQARAVQRTTRQTSTSLSDKIKWRPDPEEERKFAESQGAR